MPHAYGMGALSDAAIRRLSVRPSVCLSVCPIPLAQQRYILGLLLLQNTSVENPILKVKPTGQRGSKESIRTTKVVEMATKTLREAFARRLHHRYAPIELSLSLIHI